MKQLWFVSLLAAICLEGLGRKYLPQIPAMIFYFFKDLILVIGYLRFRPPADVRAISRQLYRGFEPFWIAGFVWTALEMVNPQGQSAALALVGLRAYWLWWLAPSIVAGVLSDARLKRRAIYALSVMAVGISILAAFQFASPADSDLNLYSVQDGEEVHASDFGATVATTGRARVAATFTFLSGFVDFTILVPALLLSLGLETKDKRLRRLALFATLASAAVVPMSGSRGSIVIGAAILLITMWAAGLFFTSIGRRVLIGAGVAAVFSVVAFPDAMLGVQSRFDDPEESSKRFIEMATVLPPVALTAVKYPAIGIGTGMQQNARASMGIDSDWGAESEIAKYLVELGPVGYMLVWTARLGLLFALFRAYGILKRGGKRGAAGAALSYAALSMIGNLVFDHVFQSLYFMGCGFILAEVRAVYAERQPSFAPAVAQIDGLSST